LIASLNNERSSAETTLHNCNADMQKTKSEIDAVSYEINLVVIHPFLEWGGLAIFAVAIASLIVTTVGIATLATDLRAGIGTVRELSKRLRRRGPLPRIGRPIRRGEEAREASVQRAEVPAEGASTKPVPEITAISTESARSKMVRPRKRKLAGAKPSKKEQAEKDERGGKQRGSLEFENQRQQFSDLRDPQSIGNRGLL